MPLYIYIYCIYTYSHIVEKYLKPSTSHWKESKVSPLNTKTRKIQGQINALQKPCKTRSNCCLMLGAAPCTRGHIETDTYLPPKQCVEYRSSAVFWSALIWQAEKSELRVSHGGGIPGSQSQIAKQSEEAMDMMPHHEHLLYSLSVIPVVGI